MNKGKQTDIQQRLDALENLPGEAIFDKELAWEKLHQRLHKKHLRRNVIGYWAAACLLPVILLLWMTGNKQQRGVLVQGATEKKELKMKSLTELPIAEKEIMPATVVSLIGKNRITKKPSNLSTGAPPAEINVLEINKPRIGAEEGMRNPVTTVISAVDSPTITVLKKKLRVVHLNELEPVPEQMVSSASHEQNGPRFTIGSNHSITSSATTERQENTGLLKIPLTN